MKYAGFFAVALFSLLLLGCTNYKQPPSASVSPTSSATEVPTQTPSATSPSPTPSEISPTPIATFPPGYVTEVSINASNYQFVPSEITLAAGAPARLKITNMDGLHTLSIPSLGITRELPWKEEITIELTVEQVNSLSPDGTDFYCSIHCSDGNCGSTGMRGKLKQGLRP